MSEPGIPRQPRSFATDDPVLRIERDEDPPRDVVQDSPASMVSRMGSIALYRRGMRWGALFLSAMAGAATLAISAWLAGFISATLAREDWFGTLTLVSLLVAAFAGFMVLWREISGFARLARIARLRQEVATALASNERQSERRAALRLVNLYRGRPDVAWGLRRFQEHARDVHDPGDLLRLAEREIVVPLDQQALAVVTSSSKRVAMVTALSPIAMISVAYVLIENVRLLHALAVLYGGRPGTLGALKLARLVLAHLLATGGIAMTDDLLGQFLGQDFLRRLSRRLGEGAINGALTARIGVTALDVIRPLPFMTSQPPRMRAIVAEAIKPLVSRAKPEAVTVPAR